jgi:hypothetical protein
MKIVGAAFEVLQYYNNSPLAIELNDLICRLYDIQHLPIGYLTLGLYESA